MVEMPTVYDDDFFGLESANYPGNIQRPRTVYSIVYPPIGFFPFAGTGNGDYHGFYWPIGRESDPPIVAYSSHDAFALIPEYGDLQGLARCQIASDEDRMLGEEFQEVFESAGESVPTIDVITAITADDHRSLLELDPKSAFRNCAVADLDIAEEKFEDAEARYRTAIKILPEYGAAHFGLGYLLRRLRRAEDASIHLRSSLICPLVFGGGCFWADHILPGKFRNDWARKALLWLQNTKVPHDSSIEDPFMQKINQLTLERGKAQSRDLDICYSLVDIYAEKQLFQDAIYLWIMIGDLAAMETTSFRERYQLTPKSFGTRLSELFKLAGYQRRSELIDNMLLSIDKPEGLYL